MVAIGIGVRVGEVLVILQEEVHVIGLLVLINSRVQIPFHTITFANIVKSCHHI